MFRSAIVRSLRASAPRVVKTPAPFHIRSSPIAAIPQFTPFQGARLYSAPAGLPKNEAEGRIVNLLKNFDKVRHIVFPGETRHSSAMDEISKKHKHCANWLSFHPQVSDASKINGASHFSNDLGLDSLDTVEVVMAIEEEFSIEIPDKEADQIHSVEKAVEYILAQPDAH
ncbi:unnamed protein product [Penicillium salamii]|nr:unnamed protein product [Penicillium salamii]